MPVYLTTRARVLYYLAPNTPSGDATNLVDALIPAVTATIERLLDRHVERKERTEFFDVECGTRVVALRGVPLTAISSVKFDPLRAFGSDVAAFSSSLYHFTGADDDPLVEFDSLGAVGRGVLRIVYTGGLGTTTESVIADFPDLADAAAQECANLFQRRDSLSIAQYASGADTTAFRSLSLSPMTMERIAARRRFSF